MRTTMPTQSTKMRSMKSLLKVKHKKKNPKNVQRTGGVVVENEKSGGPLIKHLTRAT